MNKEEVLHLAELAKLDLSDEEIAQFPEQLAAILDFIGAIQEVEIQGDVVRDFSHKNIFRQDEHAHNEGENRSEILHEMPETEKGMLKVRKILSSK